MKVHNTQADPRKNPDSTRVHGLRLAVGSSSAAVQKTSQAANRNETLLSQPLRLRTFQSTRIDAEVQRRNRLNEVSLSPGSHGIGELDRPQNPRERVSSRSTADSHRSDEDGNKASMGQHREGRTAQGARVEGNRARGNWSVSPLWEAKILLGVLKEQGLAGKGLLKAFEKWAPTIARISRSDMSRVYRQQTGREMTDYILVQLADKVVRYNQLPSEADIVRQALLNSSGSSGSDEELSRRTVGTENRPESASGLPTPAKTHLQRWTNDGSVRRLPVDSSATRRDRAPRICAKNMAIEEGNVLTLKQRLLDNNDPNILLSTNEVANLTGFRPKTIRRWVSRKLFNYIRVGNRLRFRLAAVELFLRQREVRR